MKYKRQQSGSRHEDGFLLLGVLCMTMLLLLALAIAVPRMAESIRRDKETETVHRGMQYARAIRVYYTKYGRYPNTIDQLMKSDNQRFLRKRYLDPMTGKDDWRIIHLGEAKVPAMGLFGQAVTAQGGITPTGASTGTTTGTTTGTGTASNGGFGASSSGFGSSGSSSFGGGSSGFGGTSSSPFSSSSSPSGAATTGSDTGSGFGSSPGIGGTTTTGGTATTNGAQTTGSTNGAFGSPGVTVGGAPIVGVGLLSKKESIKIYKKQTHYNQWEFVFDPTQNAANSAGGVAGAAIGAGNTANGLGSGTSTGIGGSTNGSGLGSSGSSGFGSSSGSGFGSSSGSGFGSNNGSGFGSSNGSGFGSSNGSGSGGSPTTPNNPSQPTGNTPQ
jgi:type II secretory pathway pseudopilin PulG